MSGAEGLLYLYLLPFTSTLKRQVFMYEAFGLTREPSRGQ